jgi:hypothetical protein
MDATNPDLPPGLAEAACDDLLVHGGAWIRALLAGLNGTPALTISTKAPCSIRDMNMDLRFDTLGSVAAPCEWDARFRVGGVEFAAKATFTGKAK